MKIPIVDADDNLIGHKERDDRTLQDIIRITAVFIFNDKKEFLIAKRQSTKKVSPNKWGPSVAGTLEEGETYESNANKEVVEEIDLTGATLTPYKKIYYENDNGRRFCSVFITFSTWSESEFILQEDEVAEVRWIKPEKLYNWYEESPEEFIPSMGIMINLIKEYLNETQS